MDDERSELQRLGRRTAPLLAAVVVIVAVRLILNSDGDVLPTLIIGLLIGIAVIVGVPCLVRRGVMRDRAAPRGDDPPSE